MIKFFRKIRQNMIKENRASKYILYAIGEIILVITSAFVTKFKNINESFPSWEGTKGWVLR